MAGEMSPISSRKIVPPSASSKRPFLSRIAPVKAPFTWPNSSLSSSDSGSAPQLTGTNSLLGARPLVVDGGGHQLLARAALALDQDGHVDVGQVADQVEDLEHLGVAADDAGELLDLAHAPRQRALARQVAERDQDADRWLSPRRASHGRCMSMCRRSPLFVVISASCCDRVEVRDVSPSQNRHLPPQKSAGKHVVAVAVDDLLPRCSP